MSRTDPKRLVILRHAKADWPDVADHERPLAARGRRDAPAAGRWLLAAGYLPDHVICSTALRTRETLDLAAAAWDSTPPVNCTPDAYTASADELFELVRTAPAPADTVLLVGHNPGVRDLTLLLASADVPDGPGAGPGAGRGGGRSGGRDVDEDAAMAAGNASAPELRARVEEGFPTCTLAVLTFTGGWSDLEPETGVLTDLVVPRGRPDRPGSTD